MPAPLRRSLACALFASLAPAALLFAACSSDENDAPSGPSVFDPPGAGSGGTGGTSGAAGAGGAAGASGGAGAAGAPATCVEAPTTTADFLNRCTDASCSRFDNAARLPRLVGGVLPPLP
jgi:hypothetical protein